MKVTSGDNLHREVQMDFETLSLMGVKIQWVFDRLTSVQDIKPRHIGRVVQFNYVRPDGDKTVIGTLDGVAGKELIVSGDVYDDDFIENLKSWRKAL